MTSKPDTSSERNVISSGDIENVFDPRLKIASIRAIGPNQFRRSIKASGNPSNSSIAPCISDTLAARQQDFQDVAHGIHQRIALAPFDLLTASNPRSSPPTSVVLTLWLSRLAALGLRFASIDHTHLFA